MVKINYYKKYVKISVNSIFFFTEVDTYMFLFFLKGIEYVYTIKS